MSFPLIPTIYKHSSEDTSYIQILNYTESHDIPFASHGYSIDVYYIS
jgi:hypothetical protein